MKAREYVDRATGAVVRRDTPGDGGEFRVEEDRDADGRFEHVIKYTQRGPGRADTRRLVDGQWTGDFQTTEGILTSTYRDGRLVRREWARSPEMGQPSRATDTSEPGRVIESVGGRPVKWFFYAPAGPLEREHRDTDGDGEADLFVDWVNLTVEARVPPPAPPPVPER